MFSVIHEWIKYLYGIFQFLGFGRSPLLELEDKYTEPSGEKSLDIQNELDRVEYYMV